MTSDPIYQLSPEDLAWLQRSLNKPCPHCSALMVPRQRTVDRHNDYRLLQEYVFCLQCQHSIDGERYWESESPENGTTWIFTRNDFYDFPPDEELPLEQDPEDCLWLEDVNGVMPIPFTAEQLEEGSVSSSKKKNENRETMFLRR